MPCESHHLRFLWWNLQSFSHFDAKRAGETHWPISRDVYLAKAARVEAALFELNQDASPTIWAFSEITNQAARELRDRAFPDFGVFSLDLLPRSQLQVAFLFKPVGLFHSQSPLVVSGTPRGTRPMGAIDFVHCGQRIRFIACHWQARFSEESRHTRSDLAHFLNLHIYEFLHDPQASPEARHVVVVGDLNEEPYGLLEERLHATRFRANALRREHYTDQDTSRIRLYNCSWRLLGERTPHQGHSGAQDTAGTYFWSQQNSWHTFDHVIVTGSLLTDKRPFLDEASLAVVATPTIMGTEPRPTRFEWNDGRPRGISDHLPIVGRIAIPAEESICPP